LAYISFIIANARLLAFGFVVTFFSAFGQTYFISLFSGELRALFDLSHGEFGSLYGLATLTSAALMLLVGPLIDRLDLRLFTSAVCALLIAASFYMAWLPGSSLVYLYIAILLLRFSGQGLMTHTGATTMVRYFDQTRGRALSLTSLGFAAGEAIFPLLAVSLMATIGWQATWEYIALALAVGLIPLALWLLKGQSARHRAFNAAIEAPPPGTAASTLAAATDRYQWRRRDVLRDLRFYLLLPAILAPGFISTGIFFNQVFIAESRGWAPTDFAVGFVVYAAATVAGTLVAGPIVDRYSAQTLFRYSLIPLGIALVFLAAFDQPLALSAFMVAAGVGTGVYSVSVGALLPELYGVRHLGAIRSLGTSLMVLSTALSPAVMGLVIDAGGGVALLALGCVLWVLIASLLTPVALKLKPAPRFTPQARRPVN
jgi:MFS family permease|tara:strand:+ start:1472 stop:2758 length:1287 start_codon:yes stop_codon:yes gene_type:complete